MIVAFLHVGADDSLARIMVESVRSVMSCRIVQMTDSASPRIEGVERQEMDYDGQHLMTYRMRHLSLLPDVPLVTLDTDIIVQRDLTPILDREFDVALTKRRGRIMWGEYDMAQACPYNSGVMFSKSRLFWRDCRDLCESMPDNLQRWWGDQLAIRAGAESGKYRVLELECDEYNYTPADENEDVSSRAVVHYKGPRKQWMLNARHLRQSEA